MPVYGHACLPEAGDHRAGADDGALPAGGHSGCQGSDQEEGTLTLIVKVWSNSASMADSVGPVSAMPVLLTRTSTSPSPAVAAQVAKARACPALSSAARVRAVVGRSRSLTR